MPPQSPTRKGPQQPPEKKVIPPAPIDRYAELGDPIEWYAGADYSSPPMVGIITGLGIGTVDLNVFTSHLHNTAPQEGVIHMDDPKAANKAIAEGGGWRHRPLTIASRRLLLAAGVLKWDGDSRYVVNDDVDLDRLGLPLKEQKEEKAA